MAREYKKSDVKKLILDHSSMIGSLSLASKTVQETLLQVNQSAEKIVAQEMLAILRTIPIDEINRQKRGFRIKALREYGYNTIADVATVTTQSLASVRGISFEMAVSIKQEIEEIVNSARHGIKIRISADNRTPEITELIVSIASYRKTQYIANECEVLLRNNEQNIQDAVETLSPAENTLKWIFSTKNTKQGWDEAYSYLSDLRKGQYWGKASEYRDSLEASHNLGADAAWNDFIANPIAFFNILEKVNPGILGNDDSQYGLPEDLAREIQEECYFPEGLLCELRKYQEWGVKYILHQGKVLLGDEMGLGKTVQAIATMVSLRNTGSTHFVVVCPASVISNWCREIRKMSLLSVTQVHGAGRNMAINSWIRSGGVAVTTYETTAFFKIPDTFHFSMLVVDEAHYIKNSEAKRSQNVRTLCAHSDRLLFMTGTAIENNVNEMVSLMEVLQPDIAYRVKGMEALSSAPQFRKLVAPVYYRRKRIDVLTELPDKIETKEWCTLNAEEEKAYEAAVLQKQYAEARRVSWNIDDLTNSSKAKRLLEIIDEAEKEGRKIIVFSFFLDTIRKIQILLGNKCTSAINGSISPQRRQEIIDEFDKAPAGKVLPAQIQAGGTGLNIQSASVVILCEPQFKPSIENQAISRAYRMGQARDVLVYRLLCENTIDEKISSLLEQKQEIFNAFADKSEAAAETEKEIDNKKFGELIQEEIDRINAKHNGTVTQTPPKEKSKPTSRVMSNSDIVKVYTQGVMPAPKKVEVPNKFESASKATEPINPVKYYEVYPKLKATFDILRAADHIGGRFSSDQSDGSVKHFILEFDIMGCKINLERHYVEVNGPKHQDKIIIFVTEKGYEKYTRLGTGTSYILFDFCNVALEDIKNKVREKIEL